MIITLLFQCGLVYYKLIFKNKNYLFFRTSRNKPRSTNDKQFKTRSSHRIVPQLLICSGLLTLGCLSQRSKTWVHTAAAAAKSLQSCPTLCDPMDCSVPGSCVHGIFQARVLEWGAIAFSRINRVRLCATP